MSGALLLSVKEHPYAVWIGREFDSRFTNALTAAQTALMRKGAGEATVFNEQAWREVDWCMTLAEERECPITE